MKAKPRMPLVAKFGLWMLVYLLGLLMIFAVLVGWRLRLGLDSMLSGVTGERLRGLGADVHEALLKETRPEWRGVLDRMEEEKGLEFDLWIENGQRLSGALELPEDVARRITEMTQPLPRRPPEPRLRGGPPEGLPGGHRPDPPRDRRPETRGDGELGEPSGEMEIKEEENRVKPLFLMRAEGGRGYWAAIALPQLSAPGRAPLHSLLLVKSDHLSGSGWFFDYRPWIQGGLVVLAVTLLMWMPIFWGISRYVRRLATATESIATGHFDIEVAGGRNDELGLLGDSIRQMAARLDRLIRGQKRFLADVAHELCGPLVRVRTGLGVLEHQLPETAKDRLQSIEEDVEELSKLVAEVLEFSRASGAKSAVKREAVRVRELIEPLLARECPGNPVEWTWRGEREVWADAGLLRRALANLLRNVARHAGPDARITLEAEREGERMRLVVADDGPGVEAEELPKLFDAFYRPDRSRTRDTGGSGLGLAIVRGAIEACGGEIRAESNVPKGFRVVMKLPLPPEAEEKS